MPNNYILNFKDPDGNWNAVPGLYTEIYDAYVAYCQEHSITPVSQTTYYATLGQLNDLVEVLTESPQVAALIEQLQDGVLPALYGGLGAAVNQTIVQPSGASYESLNAYLSNNTNLYTLINQLSVGKLDTTAISKGTTAPTSSTPGNYYFQYEDEG